MRPGVHRIRDPLQQLDRSSLVRRAGLRARRLPLGAGPPRLPAALSGLRTALCPHSTVVPSEIQLAEAGPWPSSRGFFAEDMIPVLAPSPPGVRSCHLLERLVDDFLDSRDDIIGEPVELRTFRLR